MMKLLNAIFAIQNSKFKIESEFKKAAATKSVVKSVLGLNKSEEQRKKEQKDALKISLVASIILIVGLYILIKFA